MNLVLVEKLQINERKWQALRKPTQYFPFRNPRGQHSPTQERPSRSEHLYSQSRISSAVLLPMWAEGKTRLQMLTEPDKDWNISVLLKPRNNPGVFNKVIKGRAMNPEDTNSGPTELMDKAGVYDNKSKGKKGYSISTMWMFCLHRANQEIFGNSDQWVHFWGFSLIFSASHLCISHQTPVRVPNHAHNLLSHLLLQLADVQKKN